MKPSDAANDVLLLSAFPAKCAGHLGMLRGQGMNVRVASHPDRALELIRIGPDMVLVDLVHGPGMSREVTMELNREPRAVRVVALHDGRIDTYLDQIGGLAVDGFCRLVGGSRISSPSD